MTLLEGALMLIPTIFFFSVLPVLFCVKRAEKLKRNKIIWGILGFVFSYFAVIVNLSLEPRKKKQR
jgi:predicted cobalt transporter CbtA